MNVKSDVRRSASVAKRTDAEREALIAARALVDRMRMLYRELEQTTGAPIGMHRALNAIGAEPGIQASHLAAALGMQRPAISQMLKAMAKRGWVERIRADADQRSVRLYLTPGGMSLLRATAGRAVGVLQRAVEALATGDLKSLAVALPALVRQLPQAADIGSVRRARLPVRGPVLHAGGG